MLKNVFILSVLVVLVGGLVGCTAPKGTDYTSFCGNGVCETDEASNMCSTDCIIRNIETNPFALHAAPYAEHANRLNADNRKIIRFGTMEALETGEGSMATADSLIIKSETRLIITTQSGTDTTE